MSILGALLLFVVVGFALLPVAITKLREKHPDRLPMLDERGKLRRPKYVFGKGLDEKTSPKLRLVECDCDPDAKCPNGRVLADGDFHRCKIWKAE